MKAFTVFSQNSDFRFTFNWPDRPATAGFNFQAWANGSALKKALNNNDTNNFSGSKFTLRIDTFEVSVSILYHGLSDRLSSMYR